MEGFLKITCIWDKLCIPPPHLFVEVLSCLLLFINYLSIKYIIIYLALFKPVIFSENIFPSLLHAFFFHHFPPKKKVKSSRFFCNVSYYFHIEEVLPTLGTY